MSLGSSGLGATGLQLAGVGLGGVGLGDVPAAGPAGIVVGAGVAYGQVATAGDMVFTLPVHNNLDLLVLAHYLGRSDDINDFLLVSTPGWVELDAAERRVFSGSAMTQRVWTKRGDGVETEVTLDNNYVGGAGFALACVAFAGVDRAIFDVTPLTSHSKLQNNSSNPTAVQLTTTVDGAVMLLFCNHSRSFSTYAPPTGYDDNANNSFETATVYACTKKVVSAGLETPGPWNTTGVNAGADNLLMSVTLAPALTDEFFANVVLLLDFAGADGGQDLTDLSNSAHVDTFNGAAPPEIDTAIQMLGENTLLFPDTTPNNVSYPDSDDWDFGTDDFTLECHFQLRNFTTHYTQLATWMSGGTPAGWFIRVVQDGEIYVVNNDGELIAEAFIFVVDTTYHIAVSRTGTDLRLFIDGVQIGATVTDSSDWEASGDPLTLGGLTVSGGGSQSMPGSLGAVRITKGVGRYTANFTPPTVFYPTQ